MSIGLLLHFNDSFEDASGNNFTLSTSGGCAISTAQKKFGAGSLQPSANDNGYLKVNSGIAFNFVGMANFTIDWWQYVTSLSAANGIFSTTNTTTNTGKGFLIYLSATTGRFFYKSNFDADANGTQISGTGVTINTWQHVALVYDGSTQTFSLYLDGSIIGTVYESTPANALNYNPTGRIGSSIQYYSFIERFFSGYIDEFRVAYNEALWTAPFTPPTSEGKGSIGLRFITPNKGPTVGGNLVTLKGSGFIAGTTATIDGNAITGLTIIDDTTITGYAPAGTLGLKNVVVTTP